jgi:hypothetical protein
MTNWVLIYVGQVVAVIEKDGNIDELDYAGNWDTITEDTSKTFKVGDKFTPELQLEYNHDVWIERGWITTPVPLTPEVIAAKNALANELKMANIASLNVQAVQ